MKIFKFAIIVFFLSVYNLIDLSAQGLKLTELLKIYSLDSLSLKEFCRIKQFDHLRITEDSWIYSYNFQSSVNGKISFIKTFPKDHSDQFFLYYYFNEKQDFKDFKDSLKVNGFKKLRSYNMFPQRTPLYDLRETYITKTLELELSMSNVDNTKYTLLLYKRVNY
jgi:hypothetical protein